MAGYHSYYKDVAAVTLESEQLTAVFLPEIGSKMASLVNKVSGLEYLWQESTGLCSRPEYDTPFDAWDMYGFDEMFPTISACYYEKKPWQGVHLPDHGEVWSLPWEYELLADKIHFWVSGIRLPYRFDKWVYFTAPHIIRFEYQVTNNTSFEQEFIWAAHPLFNIVPGMEILLPPEVKQVVNVLGGGERLGGYQQLHSWPKTKTQSGLEYRLDTIYLRSNLFEKYYVQSRLSQGWAAFYQPQTEEVIALSFPVGKVPYLGIWINEGGFANQYNAALEPCTGAFDRVDLAALHHKVGVVKAKSEYRWHLNVTIQKIGNLNPLGNLYIKENGLIAFSPADCK
jgi:hypothetical protein